MLFMFKKYTFSKKENPYKDQSLGLPKGSIRGILALTMVMLFVTAHIHGMNTGEALANLESIDNATMLVLAFYFADKTVRGIRNGKK